MRVPGYRYVKALGNRHVRVPGYVCEGATLCEGAWLDYVMVSG